MITNKTDGKCLNLVISKRKMMLFIEWHNHIQRKRTVSALIRSSPFVPLSQEAVKSEISVWRRIVRGCVEQGRFRAWRTSFPGPHRKLDLSKMAAVLCALTVKWLFLNAKCLKWTEQNRNRWTAEHLLENLNTLMMGYVPFSSKLRIHVKIFIKHILEMP